MKTALSAVVIAAALSLVPFTGGTFAAADDSAQQHVWFSPEDRAAFLDARIAALKAGLQLNAEQEKNWPPLESAMRDLAKQRAERFAAWRERREGNEDEDAEVNPIDRLARASKLLSDRAADFEKLAAAAKPLYDTLDDSQKRRFSVLFRSRMGHGQWRNWRREG
jgi:zinc resistance-associated protein